PPSLSLSTHLSPSSSIPPPPSLSPPPPSLSPSSSISISLLPLFLPHLCLPLPLSVLQPSSFLLSPPSLYPFLCLLQPSTPPHPSIPPSLHAPCSLLHLLFG